MANLFGISNSGGTTVPYNEGMLRNALMMRVGQAEGSEILAAEEIDECLEAARREINMIQPQHYFSSFPVVAGTQRYAANAVLPSNQLWDVTVYWNGGLAGACTSMGLFPQIGDIYGFLFGQLVNFSGSYISQTEYERIARQYSILKRYFGPRGWLERDGYIWLEPMPAASGVCWYAAKVPRFSTVLSIDEAYAEPFFDFAESKACRLLAAKQSEVREATWAPGKGVKTSGGEVYLRMAREAEKRFYAALGEPGGISTIFNF